ncbi:MAG: cysteine desulfurase [Candidatus Kerfeldbacteria bacterium]|nr:cysteine desulfurase [Candidatus Kerfeldbacteria bacterium]
MNVEQLKKDFPIFQHHPELVYLDSTATSLKPHVVVDAEREYYEHYGVNVHRGVYALSEQATAAYEGAREKVRKFIHATSTKEMIFVRGTTEGINVVANTYSQNFRKGDVILLSEMEHHANIVPWQALVKWIGVELRWIPVTEQGDLDLTNIDELLKGVKLVAVTHMSNVLGVVNDVKFLARKAHTVGARILVDGAQSVTHFPVDVKDLDCDFFVFSGHKMLGPTGIGVLYVKEEIGKTMEPYQRGGDMILEVTKETATWNELPWKFEAGTPNIAGAIGLGAAVDYLNQLGMEAVWIHEQELAKYGREQLAHCPGLQLLGGNAASPRGAIFAFELAGIHPHDVGSILDEQGIAVRAGHHCAMPLHARFGLAATTRASGYIYTTHQDIDRLVAGIKKVQEVFA